MKYAVIDTAGNITNIIEMEPNAEWSPPFGYTILQSDIASIGGTYIDGLYTVPAIPPQNNL